MIYNFSNLDKYILTKDEAKKIIINIYNGTFNDYLISFIAGIYNNRNPTIEEIKGFKEALLEISINIDLSNFNTIDIVGTGGDYKNTFNISTISSFIVAGAGYNVIKNGNYNFSSSRGSSTILHDLGYSFTNNESILKKQLQTTGICFINASIFNHIFGSITNLRCELGLSTFFNILGPLLNPAKEKKKLIGVNDFDLAIKYSYLLTNELINFTIISSLDGSDEISLTGPFQYYNKKYGKKIINPNNLRRIKTRKVDLICEKNSDDNKLQFLKIISGNGSIYQNEIVSTNAAFALELLNGENFETNYDLSKDTLKSGLALHTLDKLLKLRI